jgi:hypothetical protein
MTRIIPVTRLIPRRIWMRPAGGKWNRDSQQPKHQRDHRCRPKHIITTWKSWRNRKSPNQLFVLSLHSSGCNGISLSKSGQISGIRCTLSRNCYFVLRDALLNLTANGRSVAEAESLVLLILLCHKRRTQQNGQQVSRLSSHRASLIRSVAIEYGLCRSARMRRAPGPEVGWNFLGA